MGPKKKGKNKEKNKKQLANIDPDLKEITDMERLLELENQCKLRLQDLQQKRNYIQMDRDMVEKFFLNTRTQKEETQRKIVNKEAEA